MEANTITNLERKENRYQRRKAKREANKLKRSEEIGNLSDVFTYHDLFFCGIDCCKGVRWKQSTQLFETHLFSRTAVVHQKIINDKWKPNTYVNFTLTERGKKRTIDAPHINDRQPHKVLTRNALMPLLMPYCIYDNGASIKGKGLSFTYRRLKEQLRWFYRRYGTDGYVVLIDLKDYFPSAPRELVYARHKEYILNDDIRAFADKIVDSFPGDKGLVLGVEPSQLEMVSLPSAVDNYIKCQLGVHCAIHYMDDYVMIVRTREEAQRFLKDLTERFTNLGFKVNPNKSRIQPLHKPFRFCKAKFILTDTGKVITHGSRESIKRDRRKMRKFKEQVVNGEKTVKEVWEWFKTVRSYYENYNDHGRVLRLNRLFYAMFIENKETKDGIYGKRAIPQKRYQWQRVESPVCYSM